MDVQIHKRLLQLKKGIQEAADQAKRNVDEIRLIAVSKTKPPEAVREAAATGHLIFGENRVQEALEKIETLSDISSLEWHLVGHLQKNKARFCPGYFQWLHSLDSIELADQLERFCAERQISINVLIQLNLSGEYSKSGLQGWEELLPLAEHLMEMRWIKLRGLMTMPEPNLGEAPTRNTFAELKGLQERLNLNLQASEIDQLSMGMTADYEWAILEGATMIRVGSAIFGDRE